MKIKALLEQMLVDYTSKNQLQKDLLEVLEEKSNNYSFPFAKSLELHYSIFSESNNEYSKVNDLKSCIEVLILALDIIDDLQDNDNYDSIWMKNNQASAINVSISLMTIFQHKLLEIIDDKVLIQGLTKYLLNAIEGQHQDINGIHNVEQYLEMTRQKSGSLMALANVLGLSFAKMDYKQIIEDYSYDLGLIAQISNDIQDVIQFDEKSDWKLKKKTLPILYLLNPAIKEGELVRKYYYGDLSYEELLPQKNTIITTLKHSGALNFAFAQKIIYEHRVMNKVNSLPLCSEKKDLLCDQLLNKTKLPIEKE
ncbi:polyprenyl synthetase family protein [Bacillus massiliigorillae]|uniref:polyprenyl synthetase family protein n=1 Tax=Bacillus massiliigorillae TaxID=1243664 RepID=UPI0003A8468D|nr:polyprenyl synthetase family protein [Bacillus massiliigorillae]